MMRPMAGSYRVVVIEEDGRVRANTESLLAGHGFRVWGTADADEGMEVVREGGADVVVLGLAKSAQTLDLIRRLRGRFEPIPLRSPPRIIVAGRYLDAAGARFARSLGADAVVNEPLTQRLVETVARLGRDHQA